MRTLLDREVAPGTEANATFRDFYLSPHRWGIELVESAAETSENKDSNTPDSTPARSSGNDPQEPANRFWWVLAVGAASATALLVVALCVAFAQARNWEHRIRQTLPANPRRRDQRRQLTAQTTGGVFSLGDVDRFSRAFVGSAPDNTIVLREDGVAERHLRIERRNGKFWVRNLTREPVMVNGHWVKANRQLRVTLPTTIELADTVTLHLLSESSSTTDEPLVEEPHGQENQ